MSRQRLKAQSCPMVLYVPSKVLLCSSLPQSCLCPYTSHCHNPTNSHLPLPIPHIYLPLTPSIVSIPTWKCYSNKWLVGWLRRTSSLLFLSIQCGCWSIWSIIILSCIIWSSIIIIIVIVIVIISVEYVRYCCRCSSSYMTLMMDAHAIHRFTS